MPKIIVEKGSEKGKSYRIDASQQSTYLFGRDNTVDFQVKDVAASRKHFKIIYGKENFMLLDLASRNGTFLNGTRIGRAELKHGDKIQIGETVFTFMVEEEKSGADAHAHKRIAGYNMMDRVGSGGMGTVYKAEQVSLKRIVALKVLADHLAKDTEFIKKFVEEARFAAQFNHPNIVQVHDVGTDKETNTWFISMEFLGRGSLQDVITNTPKVELNQAIEWMIGAAKGLEYAEKKKVVHRDIKPDNLMLSDDDSVKIADLGIAKSFEGQEKADQSEGVFGSPHYIAPEQAMGKPIDHRADIYSLGATFYRLITGKTPFSGNTPKELILKHINETPEPVNEIDPSIPARIDEIVTRMMAKDPEKRYLSASDLIKDLDDYKKNARAYIAGKKPGKGVEEFYARRARQRYVFWSGLAAVIVLAIVFALVFKQTDDKLPTGQETILAKLFAASESAQKKSYSRAISELEEIKDLPDAAASMSQLLVAFTKAYADDKTLIDKRRNFENHIENQKHGLPDGYSVRDYIGIELKSLSELKRNEELRGDERRKAEEVQRRRKKEYDDLIAEYERLIRKGDPPFAELVDKLQAFIKNNPDSIYHEHVMQKLKRTEDDWKRQKRENDQKRENRAQAEKLFAQISENAGRAEEKGELGGALNEWQKIPKEFKAYGDLWSAFEENVKRLQKAAETRLAETQGRAAGFEKEEDWAQAVNTWEIHKRIGIKAHIDTANREIARIRKKHHDLENAKRQAQFQAQYGVLVGILNNIRNDTDKFKFQDVYDGLVSKKKMYPYTEITLPELKAQLEGVEVILKHLNGMIPALDAELKSGGRLFRKPFEIGGFRGTLRAWTDNNRLKGVNVHGEWTQSYSFKDLIVSHEKDHLAELLQDMLKPVPMSEVEKIERARGLVLVAAYVAWFNPNYHGGPEKFLVQAEKCVEEGIQDIHAAKVAEVRSDAAKIRGYALHALKQTPATTTRPDDKPEPDKPIAKPEPEKIELNKFGFPKDPGKLSKEDREQWAEKVRRRLHELSEKRDQKSQQEFNEIYNYFENYKGTAAWEREQ